MVNVKGFFLADGNPGDAHVSCQHAGDRISGFNGSPSIGLYASHMPIKLARIYFIYIGGLFGFKLLYNTVFGLNRKHLLLCFILHEIQDTSQQIFVNDIYTGSSVQIYT